ncbi:MAG: AI-2E family transporter [Firmicutes bacterium]|nr:AI-2E family transporter [Bacillota bacterium]
MLKKNFKKYIYYSLSGFGAIALSIIFFFCIYRSKMFFEAISDFMSIIMPFIYGGVIAYLLSPLCSMVDARLVPVFNKKMKNAKKAEKTAGSISVLISMLVGIIVITGVFYLVIPQVVESVKTIVAEFPQNSKKTYVWFINFLNDHPDIEEIYDQFFSNYIQKSKMFSDEGLVGYLETFLTEVSAGVLGFAGFLKNMLIGGVAAVYFLAGRRKFCAQAKKIIYAAFNRDLGNMIIDEVRYTNSIFGGFIRGKLLDSLIIGILCFIVMSVFKWPYPVLISVIIGITNIIPFFGPFIGAIPTSLIILTVSPIQSLYFIIFVVILQQFDGNILGPRILGETTGLSGFWVLFSILLFGGLFGFVGMIIGVPTFAVIYKLFSQFINWRLRKNSLPEATNAYDRTDNI